MPVERCPARSDGGPVLNAEEEVKYVERNTQLFVGQSLQGTGDLHLSNQRLVWLNSQDTSQGYAIDYPFVTVHAVCRDASSWPRPCLYCQLRTEEPEGSDEEDEVEIPELRFVPAEPNNLQKIFLAFSEMSALNPDPNDTQGADSDSGEEEEAADVRQLTGLWAAPDDDAAMEDAEESDEGPETMDQGPETMAIS